MARRTSGELKRLSRQFLIGHYTVPILSVLTASLLPEILFFPFSGSFMIGWNAATASGIAAAIIIGLLAQLFTVSVVRIHLLLAKQQAAIVSDIFWTFRNQPDRFLLGILSLWGICLFPAIPACIYIVYLWVQKNAFSYLLIGITMIALLAVELYVVYTFILIYPLLIERPELTILACFRTSYQLMRKNRLRYFGLQLSFLGWQILGFCSIGIGMLWIVPYIRQTSANFYLDLTEQFDSKGQHIDAIITDERNAGLYR